MNDSRYSNLEYRLRLFWIRIKLIPFKIRVAFKLIKHRWNHARTGYYYHPASKGHVPLPSGYLKPNLWYVFAYIVFTLFKTKDERWESYTQGKGYD